ncbi:universal stress protein [Streptomyces sp. NPDC056948]|uniref:universal stress protein n=1 Tax=Streptomyces sp. NPDC056948 TaxID=3345975 RepID=UPI00362797D9
MSVVLGYDESPGAQSALRVAIEVAAAYGEPLVIVYGAAAPGVTGDEYTAHHRAVREAGSTVLGHAVRVADEAGVPSTVELIDQRPAQALIDAAARHDGRVIVVGTWGESPVRGALLGSTPHKLLHLSNIPVLCVPATAES